MLVSWQAQNTIASYCPIKLLRPFYKLLQRLFLEPIARLNIYFTYFKNPQFQVASFVHLEAFHEYIDNSRAGVANSTTLRDQAGGAGR